MATTRCAPISTRGRRGAQGEPGSGGDHGRPRAGDRRQVPAIPRPAQDGRHVSRGRRRSSRRWDRSKRQASADGERPARPATHRRKQEGGGERTAAAEAPLPNPGGRDDRRRLQRARGVLPDGRHARPRRRSSSSHSSPRAPRILVYVVMMFVVPEANTPRASTRRRAACRSMRRKWSIGSKRPAQGQPPVAARVAAEAASMAAGRALGRGRTPRRHGSSRSCRCSGSCT